MIAETITHWGLPVWGFLIIVNLLLLAACNFMEPSAILLIMAPILFPIATRMGIDPIHLGACPRTRSVAKTTGTL